MNAIPKLCGFVSGADVNIVILESSPFRQKKCSPEFDFEVQHLMDKASAIMRRDAQNIQAVDPRGARSFVVV